MCIRDRVPLPQERERERAEGIRPRVRARSSNTEADTIGPADPGRPMRTTRAAVMAVTAAVVLAACGVEEPLPTSSVATAPSFEPPAGALPAPELEARLIGEPAFAGPWTVEADEGSSLDALRPVCGVGYPISRPGSTLAQRV